MTKMKKLIIIGLVSLVGIAVQAVDLTPMNGNWVKLENGTETVADAEVVAYENPFMTLLSSGKADGETNTVTIADPVEIGVVLVIYVDPASSNKVGIADSGNCNLSAAFVGDDDDSLSLISTATDEWTEISRSAN